MPSLIDTGLVTTQLVTAFNYMANQYTPNEVLGALAPPIEVLTRTFNVGIIGDIYGASQAEGAAPVYALDEFSVGGTCKRFATGFFFSDSDVKGHVLGPQILDRVGAMPAELERQVSAYLEGTVLSGLESTVGWDGQFFFDTDHPIPGGTWSNDISQTVASTALITQAEGGALIDNVLNTLSTARTGTGRYVGNPDRVVIFARTHQARVLDYVVRRDNLNLAGLAGASNVYSGMNVIVVPTPLISDQTKFYAFNIGSDGGSSALMKAWFRGPDIKLSPVNARTGTIDCVGDTFFEIVGADFSKGCAVTIST